MATDDVLKHNTKVLEDLEPGDLVKFDREDYYHWAVYIGNGKVIHRSTDNEYSCSAHASTKSATSASGDVYKGASVREDQFLVVAGKNEAYVANDGDEKRKPLPPDIIIKNAKDRVGSEGYNAISNNCEHFATTCRYGEAESHQVKDGITGCVLLIIIVVVFLAIVCYKVFSDRGIIWLFTPISFLLRLNTSNH